MKGVSARQRACIEEERGLSELVFLCFGMPLDKTYQISDWERRPLSQEQLIYAGSLTLLLFDRENSILPWDFVKT